MSIEPQSAPESPWRDFPGAELLRTRRLVLRGLRVTDASALMKLNADLEVSRWLMEPCPTDYIGVVRTIFHANQWYERRPGLGAWYGSDMQGNFVGMYTLASQEEDSDEVEIGMRLPRSTWGRLYPIEAGRALCRHAFETLSLPYLLGMCHPQNLAVPAILRRLGFSADGEAPYFGGRALRHVLRREDWLAHQSARSPQPERAHRMEKAT